MIETLAALVGIAARGTLYRDILTPIYIVALVTTLTLIFFPAPSLTESLIVLIAITVWYAGAIYLVNRAYLHFKQK